MPNAISDANVFKEVSDENRILAKKELAPCIKLFEVRAPLIAKKAKAGQFIILRVDEHGERIPLTIADFDREKGTITIVFQEVGKSTMQLGRLNVGDRIKDFVGPLGRPTEVEKYGRVVCIGGGVGIAPIYPIARAMKEAGNEVISIIGARCKDLLIQEKEMASVSDKLHITTDDGSYGRKGFVSNVLEEMLKDGNEKKPDFVMAVGPVVMMKAVANVTRPFGIKTVVSLNPIMIDGTGMCGGCRVCVGGKTMFTCVDGPDFDAHKVDFDLLVARQRTYTEEEKKSTKIFEEKCACKQRQ